MDGTECYMTTTRIQTMTLLPLQYSRSDLDAMSGLLAREGVFATPSP